MCCSVRCSLLAVGTQLHWLVYLHIRSRVRLLVDHTSVVDRAHSFGRLNVWNTFVHIWDDLVFVALARKSKDLWSISCVCMVCVRVPIQILRLLIHAIEQYVVKQLPPLNPNRNPKLVLCKLRTNCSVSWNNRSTIHPGNSIELASFFFCTSPFYKYIECWKFLCFFLESVGRQ